MLLKWPIRAKGLVGLGLLLLLVVILASGGLYATYSYRGLVKTLSSRVPELTVAAELGRDVGELRMALAELRGLSIHAFSLSDGEPPPFLLRATRDEFRYRLGQVASTLEEYRHELENNWLNRSQMGDLSAEWSTVRNIEASLLRIHELDREQQWLLSDVGLEQLDAELAHLQTLVAALPDHLHQRMASIGDEVRSRYRTLIVGTWVTGVTAALVFLLLVRLSWQWIFFPLRLLIEGSRRVAAGQFHYRICLEAEDEMAELAAALNDMTARFREIRDDLDRQVRERTAQVVRSEQLASVGFLAAGVAHEINNPLASIALCAESLHRRVEEFLPAEQCGAAGVSAEDRTVVAEYLGMIQREAFRCKEITEKLLDFSRIGEVRRQDVEIGDLVQEVVDMVGHLGKYQDRRIEVHRPGAAVAEVSPREIKQVVLNLLTNALDSSEAGGTVRIELAEGTEWVELAFSDDGCGMEPEVLQHIFEPFFTRRRGGGGTGLGLSITYRIVSEHGGEVHAESPGRGQGATFRVRLPKTPVHKESSHRYQAA